MIDDGLFAGLDAALLYHPCDRNHVESYPLASEDVDVVFTGLQAHASSDPWRGKNALDAMMLLFTSVGLWRQQLRPAVRVHGIIREGGTAANIIPDRTSAWFMLRSDDRDYYEGMKGQFTADGRGGAQARPGRPSRSRTRAARRRCATTASSPSSSARTWPPTASMTWARIPTPGAPTWATSAGSARPSTRSSRCASRGTPGHSIAFRDAAAAPLADEVTLLAATLVGQTAVDLFLDPAFVEAAWAEFRAG